MRERGWEWGGEGKQGMWISQGRGSQAEDDVLEYMWLEKEREGRGDSQLPGGV